MKHEKEKPKRPNGNESNQKLKNSYKLYPEEYDCLTCSKNLKWKKYENNTSNEESKMEKGKK